MASRYSELEFGRTGTSASSYDPLTRPEGLRISPSSFSSFPTPKAMSIPGAKTHDEPPPPLPPPRHVPVDGLMVFDPLERDNNPENYHLRDRSHDEGYHSVGSSRPPNPPHFRTHHMYQKPGVDHYDSNMLLKLNKLSSPRRALSGNSPTAPPLRLPAFSSARSPLSSSARESSTNSSPSMQLPQILSLPDRSRLTPQYNQTSAMDWKPAMLMETNVMMGEARSWRANSNSDSVRGGLTVSSPGGRAQEAREDEPDFPMDDASSPSESLSMGDRGDTDRDRDQDRPHKRRASSPADDTTMPLGSEAFRRRDVGRITRGSPVPRLAPITQGSLLSSTFSSISSGGFSATTPHTSASSMTSAASFGRRSPTGAFPVSPAESNTTVSPSDMFTRDMLPKTGERSSRVLRQTTGRSHDSRGTENQVQSSRWAADLYTQNYQPPYSTSRDSINSAAVRDTYSPAALRASSNMAASEETTHRSGSSWQDMSQHQQLLRVPGTASLEASALAQRDSGSLLARSPGEEFTSNTGSLATKMQGFLMCDCCPKKPKKFETPEALRAHESEKQYKCSYCSNRFKNKNEAERHQNSIHKRLHSWSCSAMTSYERAFYDSTSRPGEADSCGYCGADFPRSGPYLSQGVRHPTREDWDVRAVHLTEVHKYKECNLTKKFYRADHFRQHIKHSHAGSSGKWTNVLESACMIDEAPPTRSPQ
ncbi:hypothetical protein DL546_007718 [Coniochaeta pulveracea]|uniref:C2H2-type domain-containing protein n=1 Tax=Coniochaeta pulveracea TaxID=177199 RepID=A0A420YA95_9PEZI|nr:hypothetical protein DL546_007718 [Coniochaeta pulveracea]